jgi:Flp pilus assembly pilin Flp
MRRLIGMLREVPRDDRGAATAEYAIVIMAAVGFAGLLVAILRSGEVQAILTDLVQRALNSAG